MSVNAVTGSGSHVTLTFSGKYSDDVLMYCQNSPLGESDQIDLVTPATGIEERRRTERIIAEHPALLENARDAIIVCDPDGVIRYWNNGAGRIYGWPAGEAVGYKNAFELHDLRPDSSSAGEMATNVKSDPLHVLHECGEWSGEMRCRRKDGTVAILDSRWTMIREEKNVPESIMMIETDVTEKKGLEAQFLRAQRMESIGTMAGGIAHDLNNILTPILMWIEVLRHKLPDDKSRRMIDLLESSAQRGADMVRQVLGFSRGLEGERMEIEPRCVMKEVERIVKESFPKSIVLEMGLRENTGVVRGDATQLHQVMVNLCVNARDAMPQGGKLTLTCDEVVLDENYAQLHLDARPGRYIRLSVRDTGVGMPPAIRERVFEPFFTTKELGKGTGLGLSTALAIVRSHNGFMTVESETGRGTVVHVYLPALQQDSAQASQQADIDAPAGDGELLLVVDDEPIIRETALHTLERYNYRVLLAEDGADAIGIYSQRSRDIQLVLTDMTMPLMDGPPTIRALRKINPHIKIVGMSGVSEQEKTALAARLNIHGFMRKPFTAKEMLRVIHAALHGVVQSQ